MQDRPQGRVGRLVLAAGLAVTYGMAACVVEAWDGQGQSPAKRQQKASAEKQSQAKAPGARPATAPEELQRRLQAAEAARASGDPEPTARANERLIAAALRQLANLRLTLGAYGPAVDLYEKSLQHEDAPDVRVDLAIAYLKAGHADDAIAETSKALAKDSGNARALNVQGKAWMAKGEYRKASESLERAAQIAPNFELAYSLGICLLAQKEKARTAQIFRRIIENEGDSGSLHVLFGRAYRDAGMMEDAVRELKRAVALDAKTPHAHYFLGLSYLMLNEWAPNQQSKREFEIETENYPRDFLANYFLGVLASNEKRYADSDRYLRIAQTVDATWPETWLYLGLNANRQNDPKTAEEHLRKAVELTGSDEARANYQIRRGYIALGRILSASGRQQEAEQFMERARDLQRRSLAVSQQKVSSIAEESGAGMGAAMVPLLKATEDQMARVGLARGDPSRELDPSVLASANLTELEKTQASEKEQRLRMILAVGFNDLATSEAVSKNYALALSHYQEAERWDGKVPGLMRNLGVAAFRAENYPEGVRGLAKALAANSNDNSTRAMLGMSFFGTNAYAEAVRTIEPLGDVALRDPAVAYAWAASLVRMGETKDAERVLDGVEKGIVPPETLVLLGQLWLSMKDYPRAIADLHRAAEQNPTLPKAHYYAGIAYIRNDRPADAEAEFQRELQINPNDVDAKYSLGFVYQQQSRPYDAVGLYREVVASEPKHADAQYQLGKILLDQNNVKEAIEHLEEAARLNPNTDYVHYQLQTAYRKDSRTDDAERELQIYKELKAKNRQATLPQASENP